MSERIYDEHCEWPNPLACHHGTPPLRPLEERRREWASLGGAFSPLDLDATETKRENRSQAQRKRWAKVRPKNSHPPINSAEVLRSGSIRVTSNGYRSMGHAERLLPANVVFWRGPSVLTGDPILCLAGQHTINAKTGSMVQVYILRSDINPIQAVQTGGDDAICGDCKLRGDGTGGGRACYVQWFRAPMNIWKAPTKEWSLHKTATALNGKHVRVGAYGDPAAVPIRVWTDLLFYSAGWTAYTHQWRTCDPGYAGFCMASVDSPEEQQEAALIGWRTFRVRTEAEPLRFDEITCPAADEAGHRVTCQRCQLCRGTNRPAKSIAILAHGPSARHFVELTR